METIEHRKGHGASSSEVMSFTTFWKWTKPKDGGNANEDIDQSQAGARRVEKRQEKP